VNRNLAAIVAFSFSVLLLTRLDFLVNNILYDFNLSFSEGWYHEYSILYFLAYQLVVFVLLAYTRNMKLFTFFEVFVLTSTQDLVYFGLWQGSFPAHEWVWMPYYRIFGFWNTTNQILLSISSLALILVFSRTARLRLLMQRIPIVNSLSRKDAKPL
jgi:hypothetical protein